MEPCTATTHRAVHPSGARVESNARQWFNYGSLDDPAWFSCCMVHEINRRHPVVNG